MVVLSSVLAGTNSDANGGSGDEGRDGPLQRFFERNLMDSTLALLKRATLLTEQPIKIRRKRNEQQGNSKPCSFDSLNAGAWHTF